MSKKTNVPAHMREYNVADVLWVRRDPRHKEKLQWLTRWEGYDCHADTLQSTESLLYNVVWRRYCDKIGFPWRALVEDYGAATTAKRPVAPGAQIAAKAQEAKARRMEVLCAAADAVEFVEARLRVAGIQ